jgi:MerR family transcriptional regulator, copper efflux regulator
MSSMDRKYLNVKEAAHYLDISPLTLRNWDRKGKLTAYRHPINNYRVYRLDQLELFLRSIESPGSKPKTATGAKKIRIRTEND